MDITITSQVITEMYGMVIPLSILMMENDEDKAFMTEFYSEHRRFMLYLAKQRVGNFHDAEDIIEETVERLLKKVSLLRSLPKNRARSYLASAVRHTAINFFNRNAKHYNLRVELSEETGTAEPQDSRYEDLDDFIFNRFNVTTFLNGFHSLSQVDKDLILLRHYDNLGIDEIAGIMRMENNAVSSRLYKAKQRVIREAEAICQ